MKLSKYKNKIQHSIDGSPKVRLSVKFFRYAYFVVLISVSVYVLFFFLNNQLLLKGNGVVYFEKETIQSPCNGTVKHVNFKNGNIIDENNILATIDEFFDNSIFINNNNSLNPDSNKIKYDEEKARLELKNKSNRDNKKAMLTQLDYYNKMKYKDIYKSLELYRENDNLGYDLDNKISNLTLSIKMLDIDYASTVQSIRDLATFYKTNADRLTSRYNGVGQTQAINHEIRSSFQANIFNSFVHDGSIVKRGDTLFEVQNLKDIYIVGYFTQSKIEFLNEGDDITIIFPDGKTSTGIIKKLSVNNETKNIFDGEKSPDEISLKAEIIPIEQTSFSMWSKYNMMNVKLRKYKKWF